MIAANDCLNSYPGNYPAEPAFNADTMVCAGLPSTGGNATCFGDGGDPILAATPGGGRVQVGIASWARGCAVPDKPGVFTKLAAYTPWIAENIRLGPFDSAAEFVDRQYDDLLPTAPTAVERNALLARVEGGLAPETAIQGVVTDERTFRSTGAIVRFYYGYFGRDADSGLTYWTAQYRFGRSLNSIASAFSRSPEFQSRYGMLNNGQFVDLAYRNVLHRTPDAAGRAYWIGKLDRGQARWSVMSLFTESVEHRTATRPRVERTIAYSGMLRQAPTTAWLDLTVAAPFPGVLRSLFLSPTYAHRFGFVF